MNRPERRPVRTGEVPEVARLLSLVDAMAGQPVLMLADLVADVFITGTPKRISREAPVLILSYQGERLAPGGGANAVANVAALGGQPLLLGVVGDDRHGTELLASLEGLGVATGGVLVRAGYRTPTKVRILGGGRSSIKQQIVRYDIEETLALSAAERDRLLASLGRLCQGDAGSLHAPSLPGVAVLSDYGYGAVEPGLLPFVRAALGADGVVVCDSRYRLGDYARPGGGEEGGFDGATPNEEEAEALLGASLNGRDEVSTGGRRLRAMLGASFLLITRGSRGMSLFQPAGEAHLPVSGTDQVADVTGAGDTVIGTFALALAAGADPLEAALLSDYAGGIVVMKMGTATLTREELKHAIRHDGRPREELRWQASGGE